MEEQLSAQARAKRPRTVIAGPYGHPFHGILVTVPIGSWIAALIFDIIALFVADHTPYIIGARALVAVGVIGAVVAAIFGFIDFTGIAPSTRARRIALLHMTANLTAVVVFIISFVLRLASADSFSTGGFILTIIGLAILAFSGFLGGELVYRYGVRVADEQTQANGYIPR